MYEQKKMKQLVAQFVEHMSRWYEHHIHLSISDMATIPEMMRDRSKRLRHVWHGALQFLGKRIRNINLPAVETCRSRYLSSPGDVVHSLNHEISTYLHRDEPFMHAMFELRESLLAHHNSSVLLEPCPSTKLAHYPSQKLFEDLCKQLEQYSKIDPAISDAVQSGMNDYLHFIGNAEPFKRYVFEPLVHRLAEGFYQLKDEDCARSTPGVIARFTAQAMGIGISAQESWLIEMGNYQANPLLKTVRRTVSQWHLSSVSAATEGATRHVQHYLEKVTESINSTEINSVFMPNNATDGLSVVTFPHGRTPSDHMDQRSYFDNTLRIRLYVGLGLIAAGLLLAILFFCIRQCTEFSGRLKNTSRLSRRPSDAEHSTLFRRCSPCLSTQSSVASEPEEISLTNLASTR